MVIMLGISITTSIFVGGAMGHNDIKTAKLFEKVAIGFALSIGVILAILIWVFDYSICSAFTTNTEILSLASSALRIVAFVPILLAIFYTEQGVFRGIGK